MMCLDGMSVLKCNMALNNTCGWGRGWDRERASTFVPSLFISTEYPIGRCVIQEDTGLGGPSLVWCRRTFLMFLALFSHTRQGCSWFQYALQELGWQIPLTCPGNLNSLIGLGGICRNKWDGRTFYFSCELYNKSTLLCPRAFFLFSQLSLLLSDLLLALNLPTAGIFLFKISLLFIYFIGANLMAKVSRSYVLSMTARGKHQNDNFLKCSSYSLVKGVKKISSQDKLSHF